MIRTALRAGACAAPLLLAACAAPAPPPGGWYPPPPQAVRSSPVTAPARQDDFRSAMMAGHNMARRDFGVAQLAWDPALAADAGRWAAEMARTDRFGHSPRDSRGFPQGENIWRGSGGAYPPSVMVRTFTDEKRYFRSGTFPANSTTGNWRDVGHYTAIVWPTTTHVGCALASSRAYDYLVCRYSPPGNRDGVRLAPR